VSGLQPGERVVVEGGALLSEGALVRIVNGAGGWRCLISSRPWPSERPVLTTMLVVVCVVLGIFGFTRLQTDLFPEVEFPVVSVVTIYPGAGPEEIETQVTDRIEEAVSTLAGIDRLHARSRSRTCPW
jgi:hypothetical protein